VDKKSVTYLHSQPWPLDHGFPNLQNHNVSVTQSVVLLEQHQCKTSNSIPR
jgi:hypothetical protein